MKMKMFRSDLLLNLSTNNVHFVISFTKKKQNIHTKHYFWGGGELVSKQIITDANWKC